MKRILILSLLALVFAAPAVAASSSTTLHIFAVANALKYNTSHLTARPGVVTIVMTNKSALSHDVEIKGHGVTAKGKLVGKNGVSTATAKLKAGMYEFLCTVPGHAAAGMKGTLVVK